MGAVLPLRAGGVRRNLIDGLANLYSKLGTAFDRNTQSQYYAPILSQQQIEAAYRSSWLTRKVHDLIPFEMTRAGRDWQAGQQQIEAIEALETQLCVWAKLRSALTTARLHGGAALIMGVRQGSPETPLVVDRLGKDSLRYLYVASRHQMYAPYGFETDPESDYFGAPAMWEMRGARGDRVKIHPSRVIPFHGSPLPPASAMLSQLDAYWGDPLLISIKSAIDNAETVQAAVATLLHEMKQDVISIPGLTEQIATEGSEERLALRIEAVEKFKSMFGALLLDGGDEEGNGKEEWETRQVNFSQHPELLRSFIGIVAGAADIPVTRLAGESPGGLNSTGKGEQDDLNRMVRAKQDVEVTPPLARLDEVLIRSALGSRPAEIYYEFAPLEEERPKEAAEVEYLEAQALQLIVNTALVPSDALGTALVNRMIESGKWPGLDKALEASAQEPGEAAMEAAQQTSDLAKAAANENTVTGMAQRKQITNDQAITMLTDASPRSLYVYRPVLNAAEIIAWAKGQGFETTVPADQMHATITRSTAFVDWMKMGEAWGSRGDNGNMIVEPGGARIVEPLGSKGAIVLLFWSGTLAWRHDEMVQAGASWDFPEYQPHITITYKAPPGFDWAKVVPYRGKLEFGPEVFEEIADGWADTINEK